MTHFANSTFDERLAQLAKQPNVFLQLNRGIEREALRISDEGQLSAQPHPQELGSALTHQWITTDFAEQLLEFITPVSQSLPETLQQLQDIHRFTFSKLHHEALWPLSMPCYVKNEDDIMLAQYGSSNVGKTKTLYRQGLKHRYGSMMQIIAGVHFNFSFDDVFWQAIYGEQPESERQAAISEHYFAIIRNYYRFGWMIPYLFGASPAVCGSFINKTKTSLPFVPVNANEQSYYLPYATSLRLSDLGYTNSAQSGLDICFDSLAQYLAGVKTAIATPSAQFAKIGVKDAHGYRQLNSNVLQIENELYAPIRPKRVPLSGEKPAQALARAGVQYIEVRSLDVNPYSAVGIDDTQIRFLDLFLIWCALSDSAPMTNCELECWRQNWRKIVLEGRKPGLELQIGCHGEVLTQAKWGQRVFAELEKIAVVMDKACGGDHYQQVCQQLSGWFIDPDKTLSARFLQDLLAQGCIIELGNKLAHAHKHDSEQRAYQAISKAQFEQEAQASRERQTEIEQQDNISFDQYLARYVNNATAD